MNVALAFGALMAFGAPIFIVLALTALIFILSTGEEALFSSYLGQFYGGMSHFGLLAIPLFILVGEMMNASGITLRLIGMSKILIGSVRSGLAYVNVVANGFMAAIIGSSIAQTAVMTRVIVPEMEKAGYTRASATAITCAGGLLGPIIPPSMPFIIYAVLAQVPVSDMFLAGIVPGLLLGGGFLILTGIIGFRRRYPISDQVSRKDAIATVLNGVPGLAVPATIILTILLGLGSPTDSAAMASLVAGMLGVFLYRELRLSDMPIILERTGLSSAMVLVLIAAANVFGWVTTYENIPQMVAEWITALATSPAGFLLLVTALLLAIGTIMDGMAAMIIVVPVLLPIATGIYSINPVEFGVIIVVTLVLGLLTPPVGACLYVAAGIAEVPPWDLFREVTPYIVFAIAIVVLLCYFPGISTFWMW